MALATNTVAHPGTHAQNVPFCVQERHDTLPAYLEATLAFGRKAMRAANGIKVAHSHRQLHALP